MLVDQQVAKDRRDRTVVAAQLVHLAQAALLERLELPVPQVLGECAGPVARTVRVASPENWVSVAQLGLLAVSVQLDPSVARVGLAPRVLPALLVL